ncbi:hypothetical protein QCA50_013556 [Cerrena zonata]|uniref:Uncharacterized protein n=1 Tax=Cerrena zonata TaxID=2478898 RepID=A0AAW0FUU8_9APHY
MTNPLFKVTQDVVEQLNEILGSLQARAPSGNLTSCHTIYLNLIRTLRGSVLRKAADTADYLLNNVYRDLSNNSTAEQKRNIIDRFVQSLGAKVTATRSLKHETERLRDNVVAQAATLSQLNANSTAISNQFTTIINGIQSIDGFYAKVREICARLRGEIEQTANMSIIMQGEARWLTAVSQDYKTFSPHV